jgi:branched-chain amino acid transport system ATP-binding protein
MGSNQILGLIGPNGSGKTTIFNCINRIVSEKSGDILFDGKSILGTLSQDIIKLGISRTFQHVDPYKTLSVLENVMMGGNSLCSSGYISNALRFPKARVEEKMLEQKAKELLRDLELYHLYPYPVTNLPFTVLKRIELARAMMSDPKLLLMDEPAGGLNHKEIEKFKDYIYLIKDKYKTSILLIEHHMDLLMSVSDYVIAMASGEKIAEGSSAEVQSHPEVIRIYLGEETE